MRGAAVLKQPLPATIDSAEMALRSTRNTDELQSVWWRDAEQFSGDARVRLQDVFADKLRSFGALHG